MKFEIWNLNFEIGIFRYTWSKEQVIELGWLPWPFGHRRKVGFKGPLLPFDGFSYGGRGADAIISHADEAVKRFNYKGSIVKFISNVLD